MILWAVGHGRRDWLSVEIRDLESGAWREGVIQGEWSGTLEGEIPVLPAEDAPGNTDPLVIGKFMYYDYCKKGRIANTLEIGDTVLFGYMRWGEILIDTVLVVGDRKAWPTAEPERPAWPDLDEVAKRVHFQSAAHQIQHPEVHEVSPSFSFRGKPFSKADESYSWVPYRTTRGEPFR